MTQSVEHNGDLISPRHDTAPSAGENLDELHGEEQSARQGLVEIREDVEKMQKAKEAWMEKIEEKRENALDAMEEMMDGFFSSGGEYEDAGRDSAEDLYARFKIRVYEENKYLINKLFDDTLERHGLAESNFTLKNRDENSKACTSNIDFNLNIITETLRNTFEYYASLSRPQIEAAAVEEKMIKPSLNLKEMKQMDAVIPQIYGQLHDMTEEKTAEGGRVDGNAAFLQKYATLREGEEIDHKALADLIRQVFDVGDEIGKKVEINKTRDDKSAKNKKLQENIAQEAILVSFVNRMDRTQKHELVSTILAQYPDHAPQMIREMVTRNFLSVREARDIGKSEGLDQTSDAYKDLYNGTVTKEVEQANKKVQEQIQQIRSTEEGGRLLDRFTVNPTKGGALVLGTLYSGVGLLLNAVVNRHLIYTRNGWNFSWVGDFGTFLSNPSLLFHAGIMAACIEYGTDKEGIMGQGAISKFLATPRWGALKEAIHEDQLRDFFSQYELYAGVGTYLENHFDAIKGFVDTSIMKEVTDEDGNKRMVLKSNPETEIERVMNLKKTDPAFQKFQAIFPKDEVAGLDGLDYKDAVNKLVELYLKVTIFHLDDYPITSSQQLKDFIHEVRGE
ncbi:hypothetical protein HYV57_04630 [Candidatus Peregrinibacteria bacterium]|nr:hypothetical protein [Candidatus Peregrinibacteria bacterium]